MYDFIVLGIVPGTHTQLDFYDLLRVICTLLAFIAAIMTFYNIHKKHFRKRTDYNRPGSYSLISI